MLITNRFVILNNPKTGSTFVRTVLKQLHEAESGGGAGMRRLLRRLGVGRAPALHELMFAPLSAPHLPPNQHGAFSQIPPRYRGKEVVSVVRDPFARLLSIYKFRWWADHLPLDLEMVTRELPDFPELSLDDFLRLQELLVEQRFPGIDPDLGIGWQTVRFIEMFFRDPFAVLEKLDEDYLGSDQFHDHLPPIHFLRTENLNTELFDFLRSRGYDEERLRFIPGLERVNVTGSWDSADSSWSPALVNRVLRQERLLFRILEHLGFHYQPPVPA